MRNIKSLTRVERERMRERGRERNRGWERVRSGGEARVSGIASFHEDPRRTSAGNRDGQQQGYIRENWRDKNDVSTFYFTRFTEDTTEKELWYHFKRWGDVREIFISKQKNKNGTRFGFTRFKGVKDAHKLAKEMDKMVIGGLKLYVNIPKYGRDTLRMESQRLVEKDQYSATRWRQTHAAPASTSYATVVTGNKRRDGQEEHTSTKTMYPPYLPFTSTFH